MAAPRSGAFPVTWITDHLGVGAAPMSHAALDSLRRQGVRAILNLCQEFSDLHEIEADAGFEVYHLPIADEEAPDLAELEKALAWLDEATYLGRKVYIHCRHGIGRTGTVLNAYLLRRGLGHLLAWRRLLGLRSQPANFSQWRAVRRYGATARRLTLRQPTLEHRFQVDMEPFFADYARLLEQAAEAAAQAASDGECGRTHARCCETPPRLSLAEAVRVNAGLGAALSSEARARAIGRATARRRGGGPCPLLEGGACAAFDLRPLACRAHDLPEPRRRELWEGLLAPALAKLSREVYQALSGRFMPEGFPDFGMCETVTGRYVQVFFNWQRTGSREREGAGGDGPEGAAAD